MTKEQITVHFKLNAKKNLKTEGLHQAYLQGAEDCWDYTMERRDELYNQGLDDTWNAVRKIFKTTDNGGYSAEQLNEIFGCAYLTQILCDYTPQETLAKLEAYEKEKIKVNNVVMMSIGEKAVVTSLEGDLPDECYVLYKDGSCGSVSIKQLTKTDENINIQQILDEI